MKKKEGKRKRGKWYLLFSVFLYLFFCMCLPFADPLQLNSHVLAVALICYFCVCRKKISIHALLYIPSASHRRPLALLLGDPERTLHSPKPVKS